MADRPPPDPEEPHPVPEPPEGSAPPPPGGSDGPRRLLDELQELAGRDRRQLDDLAGLVDALRSAGARRTDFDEAAIWRRVEMALWKDGPGARGGGDGDDPAGQPTGGRPESESPRD